MDRQTFLTALEAQLRRLPEQERQQSLRYYEEMIDDRMEEGMDEQAAVAAMGDVAEIAQEVLMELSLPRLVKTRLKPQRKLRVWEIVLLALGSPVWLPVVMTAVVLFLVFYLVLWILAAACWCVCCERARRRRIWNLAAVAESGFRGAVYWGRALLRGPDHFELLCHVAAFQLPGASDSGAHPLGKAAHDQKGGGIDENDQKMADDCGRPATGRIDAGVVRIGILLGRLDSF